MRGVTAVRSGVSELVLVGLGVVLGAFVPWLAFASSGIAGMWIVAIAFSAGVVALAYRQPRCAGFAAAFTVIALAFSSLASMMSTAPSFN